MHRLRFALTFICIHLFLFTAISQINNENTEEQWLKRMIHLTQIVPNNIDSVVTLGKEHLKSCPYNQDKKQGFYHSMMAEAYYFQQDLSNSLSAYKQSLEFFERAGDQSRHAVLYNNIGLIHYLKANFDSALVAYSHSLEIEKKADNKEGIAQSLQNIGIIYGKWERYALTEEYYQLAMEIYKELDYTMAVADINNNLAVISVRQKNYKKALANYKDAYELYKKIGHEKGVASVASNLGHLFTIELQIERALHYFDVALEVFHRIDDKVGLVHTYSMMGEMHMKNGKLEDALKAYNKASEYNKKVGLREIQQGNLEELYKAYKAMGQFELANEALEASYLLKDSIFDEENFDKVLELEKKYHAEKSQKELIMLRAKEDRNRMYMWGVSILFLLLTVIVLIWVYVLKIKEKQRQTSMEQKVLRSQMNPHFIFNSLSALQCIILENNKEDAIDFIADFSGLMRMVLQYAKEEHITLKKEKEILEMYMSLQNKRFDNKINYSIEIDEQIQIDEVLIPPMLTQPFIENAIEHGQLTKNDSYINVSLTKNEDILEFSIEDNGIGIKNSIEAAKKNKKKHKSIAVGITRERLNLLNSKENTNVTLLIEDLSEYGKQGTRVVFKVPYITLN